MAIQLTDFTRAPIDEVDVSPYSNAVQNVLEAYYRPQMMEQGMFAKEHENAIRAAQAKYAEPMTKAELENLQRQALGQALTRGGSSGPRQYAPSHLGKLMQERDMIAERFGEDSPQARAYDAQISKLTQSDFALRENPTEEKAAIPGSYSLVGKPAGEVNAAYKEMRGDIAKSTNVIEGARLLDDLEKLITTHPNLSESFAAAMNGDEGIFDWLKKQVTSQKDRAAIEKFKKITSELVQKGAAAFGGRAFTDARQKLLEDSKANYGLTDEANKFVIQSMRHMFDKTKGEAQKAATKRGLETNTYVPYDPEVFSGMLEHQGSMQNQRALSSLSDEEIEAMLQGDM